MAPSTKQTPPKGAKGNALAITDPRFANMATDPRFRLPSKKNSRVKLDSRFSRLFNDSSFASKASVDRYGRPLDNSKEKQWLEKMYQMGDKEEDDDDQVDDDEEVRLELKKFGKKGYDPARDGGFSESSSSEDSGSEDEDSVGMDEEEEKQAELAGQQHEVPLGEVTRRLAVVNLDWDNIRAVDLMAVASSFVLHDGKINSVSIYPSEFGRERLDQEELEGPPKDIFATSKSNVAELEEDSDFDESRDLKPRDDGKDFDSKALRNYQLERLRYFYAVIVCSTKESAQAIYENLDGREYLSSANFFDLRFVPDDTSFEDDKARDTCSALSAGYKPIDFKTDALTHSKVRLTWDEDDQGRKEAQKRAFTQREEAANDLEAYVASDSSSDDEVGTDMGTSKAQSKAASLRAALGLSAEPKLSKSKENRPVGNLQVTFSAGLNTGKKGRSVFENEPIVEETTIEKYKRKEKERKAKRKEKARAVRDGVAVNETSDAALSKDLVTPADEEKEDDGFNDPFFEDPDGPAARAAAKTARRAEKDRKRAQAAAKEKAEAAERAELELLIVDDKNPASKVEHFDMGAIVKAEKVSRKRGKKARQAAVELEKDDFQMDVKDPRFARLFGDHEFAIDPNHPRFQRTKAMEALLVEGRKRKDRLHEDEPAKGNDKKPKQTNIAVEDSLGSLADKIKRKSKIRNAA